MIRCGTGTLAILSILLSGCLTASLPSQKRPMCSWSTAPPPNSTVLCSHVFTTLAAVVRAEARGDDATVRRLTVPSVAARIIAHGRTLRREVIIDMHVVPSFRAAAHDSNRISAGFILFGKTRRGRINSPQTVYLQIRKGVAHIVGDQHGQEW